jgi:hypothetical protein
LSGAFAFCAAEEQRGVTLLFGVAKMLAVPGFNYFYWSFAVPFIEARSSGIGTGQSKMRIMSSLNT